MACSNKHGFNKIRIYSLNVNKYSLKLQLRNFKKYNKIDVIKTKTDEIRKQQIIIALSLRLKLQEECTDLYRELMSRRHCKAA